MERKLYIKGILVWIDDKFLYYDEVVEFHCWSLVCNAIIVKKYNGDMWPIYLSEIEGVIIYE